MKSPISRVGCIEPDGILKGSKMNDRNINTINSSGNNDRPYSTGRDGSSDSSSPRASRSARRLRKQKRSSAQITPLMSVREVMIRAKSSCIAVPIFYCRCIVMCFLNDGRVPNALAKIQGQDKSVAIPVGPEHCKKSFLRNLNVADVLHPALARLLLLEQLALARNVATVALCGHVLAIGLDRRTGNDVGPHRGLDGDIEHLTRNQFAHPLGQVPALALGQIPVDDRAQGIDALAVDQQIQAHERPGLVSRRRIFE